MRMFGASIELSEENVDELTRYVQLVLSQSATPVWNVMPAGGQADRVDDSWSTPSLDELLQEANSRLPELDAVQRVVSAISKVVESDSAVIRFEEELKRILGLSMSWRGHSARDLDEVATKHTVANMSEV